MVVRSVRILVRSGPVRGASGPVRFLRKSGNLYEKIGQIFCLKIY